MPQKNDHIRSGMTRVISAHQAEHRVSLFWFILVAVGLATCGIIFLVVKIGSVKEGSGKEKKTPALEEVKNTSSPRQAVGEISEHPAPLRRQQDSGKGPGIKGTVPSDIKMPADLSSKLQDAERLIAAGRLLDARNVLYNLYGSIPSDSPARPRIEDLIGKVNIGILKSPVQSPEKKEYKIEKGDVLFKIADKFGTTVDVIKASNRIDPKSDVIHPGKTLLIYQGKWNIKISKSADTLRLMDGERLFKVYPVRFGRQRGEIKSGQFVVSSKQPLSVSTGDRKAASFLALSPSGTSEKTVKPWIICEGREQENSKKTTDDNRIFMGSEDVDELCSIVPINTIVTIGSED